jgi:thiol-disulfide isomerase/thioredoxin
MVLTKSFEKLKRGDEAPDFSLRGVDGKTYALPDFTGKEGLLVIFMCNHCPYVKAKIDAIVQLYEKWGSKIAVIGINSNDPAYPGEGMENMQRFVSLREIPRSGTKERGIRFPYLLDETQEVAKAYGATCTPDPFLFDKEQKLIFHGRIDDALEIGSVATEHTMDATIQDLIEGKEIPDEFKTSLGCSIKWIG